MEDNKTQEKNPEAKKKLKIVDLKKGYNPVPKGQKNHQTAGYNPPGVDGGRPTHIPPNIPPKKTENKK